MRLTVDRQAINLGAELDILLSVRLGADTDGAGLLAVGDGVIGAYGHVPKITQRLGCGHSGNAVGS